MKATGIIREIDSLGRIVLPKSIRETFDLKDKDGVEIYIEGDSIVLKKCTPFCVFCGKGVGLVTTYRDKSVCRSCLSELEAKK